jgi:hypothetical protein
MWSGGGAHTSGNGCNHVCGSTAVAPTVSPVSRASSSSLLSGGAVSSGSTGAMPTSAAVASS